MWEIPVKERNISSASPKKVDFYFRRPDRSRIHQLFDLLVDICTLWIYVPKI